MSRIQRMATRHAENRAYANSKSAKVAAYIALNQSELRKYAETLANAWKTGQPVVITAKGMTAKHGGIIESKLWDA